jgi:TPR repeat protein
VWEGRKGKRAYIHRTLFTAAVLSHADTMIRTAFIALALLIALALPAHAGPFEDGQAAYERRDYDAALSFWQPLADEGDAEAQYSLGLMHRYGQSVPQDFTKAAKWYRRAAEQGHFKAQTNLGRLYNTGQGLPLDYVMAVKWFRKAADQGTAYAQSNLGSMYADGHGVEQDYGEAVKWYRLAAEQGNDLGQYNLGNMYANGEGMPQDFVQAHMWFDLAAASYSLSVIAGQSRDALAEKMSPDQIAEAKRMAGEWLAGHKQ